MFLTQRRVLWALLIVCTYLTLECISWFYLRTRGLFTAADLREQYQEKLPSTYFKSKEHVEDFYFLSPHPYFGNVQNRSLLGPVNPYGFSDPKAFPWEKTEDTFVLGILGGEVSLDLGVYWEKHPELAPKILSAFGQQNKKLMLVNLALPGSKEPQNFFIFSHFLHLLDGAVCVEGHNELFEEDLLPAPLEYPWNYSWLFPSPHAGETSRDFYLQLLKYTRWQGFMSKLPLDIKLLSHSGMYFLLWKNVLRNLELARVRLEKLAGPKWPMSFSKSQIQKSKLEIWHKYASLAQSLARSRQVALYLFLQPNAYVKGSKMMDEEEQKLVLNEADEKEKSEGYDLLISATQKWKSEGLLITDLTQIFQTEMAATYADDVSGLNEKGTALLAEAIIAQISKNQARPASPSSLKHLRGRNLVR